MAKLVAANRQKIEDAFIKNGLAWMIALARVELAATQSMYGDRDDPFQVSSAHFGTQEFLKVLKDDVTAHMNSLARERGFKEVLRPSRMPDTWTLAYLRRIKLIRDMLTALKSYGDPQTQDDIDSLSYELASHQRKLVDMVNEATSPTTGATHVATGKPKAKAGQSGCQQFVKDNFGTEETTGQNSSPGGSANESSSSSSGKN